MEQNNEDSCGLATRPIHRRERSGRGGLGGSPLESEAVLRNITYLNLISAIPRKKEGTGAPSFYSIHNIEVSFFLMMIACC